MQAGTFCCYPSFDWQYYSLLSSLEEALVSNKTVFCLIARENEYLFSTVFPYVLGGILLLISAFSAVALLVVLYNDTVLLIETGRVCWNNDRTNYYYSVRCLVVHQVKVLSTTHHDESVLKQLPGGDSKNNERGNGGDDTEGGDQKLLFTP